MKRSLIALTLILVLLLTIPVSLVSVYLTTPDAYTDTYYGALTLMYERLKKAEGRRIILIGGSAIAFGVNVSFMEAELDGYTVCPFGLYGTLGTKFMLDLAMPCLREGDVVVLSPEIAELPLSLYYSSAEIWKAAESDLSVVLFCGDPGAMVGSFPEYVADRFRYATEGKPDTKGVYRADSFDENCQMVYPREYNNLPDMYDPNEPVTFDPAFLQPEFVGYLNEYHRYCSSIGAAIYYNFCPVNRMAVSGNADIEGYYQKLLTELDFPVLGDPNNYLMDPEWFYDSNFHLNTAGSLVYTARLTEDVKSALGDSSPTAFEMPQKPVVPMAPAEGNNRDADCFTYEVRENGIHLTGRTQAGMEREELILPSSYEGLPVVSFSPELFAGDVHLQHLTIPATVRTIYDDSFFGCAHLEQILLEAEIPNCTVGTGLLNGCQNARIMTPNKESYLGYIVNYYWAKYASRTGYLE